MEYCYAVLQSIFGWPKNGCIHSAMTTLLYIDIAILPATHWLCQPQDNGSDHFANVKSPPGVYSKNDIHKYIRSFQR